MEKKAAKAVRRPLLVWDLPTRLFHWVLAVLLGAAWLTVEYGRMEWHAWIGQTILALVVWRLIWGVIGSETAQFWNFIKGPRTTGTYGRGLLTGKVQPAVGHNPLGALMIVLLLLLIGAQAVLGLFANDDILFDGPLVHLVDKSTSDRLTGIHQLLFDVILYAVIIHVAAALFYLVVKRENLIGAMITGRKWWPAPLPSLRMSPTWLAVPALAIAAALVWAAVNYL